MNLLAVTPGAYDPGAPQQDWTDAVCWIPARGGVAGHPEHVWVLHDPHVSHQGIDSYASRWYCSRCRRVEIWTNG